MHRLITHTLLCLLVLTLPCHLNGQDEELSILVIGDVMQHMDQIYSAYNEDTQTYDYNTFDHVADVIQQADVAIANLEFTLGGEPYSGYPQFSAPDEIAVALKNAGVDYLVTANNHSCDRRRKGVIRTVDILDSLDFPHTGTYKSLEDKKDNFPLIIDVKGIRIALLNYTYGTNGIPVPKGTMVDLIDKKVIKTDLELARSYKVDKILVFLHWGLEYQRNPSADQQDLARYCFDNGADFVIGSHPHVLQRMENSYNQQRNKDEVLVYSLGNFVSHQRDRYRDGGAMVQINLGIKGEKIWTTSVGYYLTWVYNVNTTNDKEEFLVLPASQFQQDRQFLDDFSFKKMNTFITDSQRLLGRQNINVHQYTYDLESGKWKLE